MGVSDNARSSWRNPAGLALPDLPDLPALPAPPDTRGAPIILPARRRSTHTRQTRQTRQTRTAGDGWRWEGRIIARAWPDGFTEAEYRLLLCGGRKRRQAVPDGFSAAGQPRWTLSDAERRARERLLNRECLSIYETRNIACNAGRAVLLSFIGDASSLQGIQYFAVGTGSIPSGQSGPQASDTQLWSEYYRTTFSTTTVSGGQVDISTIFAANVANTTYTEAGVFGNGATGTAGSGTLFAHALYSYQKQAGTVLTNDYLITLT